MFRAILDLSHTVSADAPSWEDAPNALTAEVVSSHEREGYYVRRISLDEHTSTHLDAPAHMAKAGWTVDQIPAERLVGPLVLLDVSRQARLDADYRVRNQDIGLWEEQYGMIPPGAIVIAYTGWAVRYASGLPQCRYARGSALPGVLTGGGEIAGGFAERRRTRNRHPERGLRSFKGL